MKIILNIIVFLFIINITYSQPPKNFKKNTKKSFSEGLGKPEYSFNASSQVGTSFNNSYYWSNYFSPNAKIDFTKRLSVVVGVGASYSQLNGNMLSYNNEISLQNQNLQQTSFFSYASGMYKLTAKVNVNATVFYENATIQGKNSPVINKQYKDVSVGVNYNVTKHFSINAQIQFSSRPHNNFYNNGYSNFSTTPFGNYRFGGLSPFY
jgi:hypothetical protein